MSNLNNKKSK